MVPNHTQKGPRAVSNNIKSPILEACVYLVAKVKQANEIGRITSPEKEIETISPSKSKLGATNKNAITPFPKALIPVIVIAGMFGFNLRRTRLKPREAEALIPHIAPTNTLPWGALITSLPCITDTPTPIRAKNAVIQVALVVFSLSIKIKIKKQK